MAEQQTLVSEAEGLELARARFASYMMLMHRTDSPHLWTNLRGEGMAVPAAHHMEMIEALKDEHGHTLLVLPRGAGKTSLMQYWLEWKLGRASLESGNWAQQFRALYLSHAAHRAYAVSLGIMNTIQQPEYQKLFPKVQPSKQKWSESEWRVKGNEGEPHATFVAGGIESPPLGGRFSRIILDDIADKQNMKSILLQDDIRATLNQTVAPMLVPDIGRYVMTATRWAWADPVAWAQKRGWHEIYRKALTEDEDGNLQSYWPERFSVEHLLAEKENDARAFAKQYQNEVAPEEGLVFQRWWFHAYEQLPVDVMWKVQSWDTAAGMGRNRSYSAGWSALVTPDFHIWLRDLRHGQFPWGQLKTVAKTYALIDKPHVILIEQASSGIQLLAELRADPEITAQVIDWLPAGSGQKRGNKEGLVAAAAEFCAQGRVHLPSPTRAKEHHQDWLEGAEDDLFSYGESEGRGDDTVDALCQMIYWVREQEKRRQRFVLPEPMVWAKSSERALRV